VSYSVSVQHVAPRRLAVVRERMPLREVPSRFRPLLDQVYAMAKSGAIALDGQNVFVYHAGPNNIADVEFGVGVSNAFAPNGRVEYSEVPGGDVATTTHWGDYGALGAAHEAVVAWCRSERLALAGVSWEVYGHWTDDPSKRRTDIYQLLKRAE
jgi:effector-binding domain-containing protein